MRSSFELMRQILISIGLIGVSYASIPRSEPLSQTGELGPLAVWLAQTGRPSVIRGRVAEAFSLPPVDIPVRERGFRTQGDKLTKVAALAESLDDVLVLSDVDESDGSAIVWLTSTSGALSGSVRFNSPEGATRISSSEQEANFNRAKNYFSTMANTASKVRSNVLMPSPEARSKRFLGSEFSALASAPWLLIGITIASVCSCQKSSRRR